MDRRKVLAGVVMAAMLAAGVGGTAAAKRARPRNGVSSGAGGQPGGGQGGITNATGGGAGGQLGGGSGGDTQGQSGGSGQPAIISDRRRKTDVVAVAWD